MEIQKEIMAVVKALQIQGENNIFLILGEDCYTQLKDDVIGSFLPKDKPLKPVPGNLLIYNTYRITITKSMSDIIVAEGEKNYAFKFKDKDDIVIMKKLQINQELLGPIPYKDSPQISINRLGWGIGII